MRRVVRDGLWVAVPIIVIGGAYLGLADATGSAVPGVPLPWARVPPAEAPVATVASTYLRAAQDHECGLTKELTLSSTWPWCNNPRLIAYSHVEKPQTSTKGGPLETCVAFTMTTRGTDDGTILAGDEPWSLCFTKTLNGWRVLDQGQG